MAQCLSEKPLNNAAPLAMSQQLHLNLATIRTVPRKNSALLQHCSTAADMLQITTK